MTEPYCLRKQGDRFDMASAYYDRGAVASKSASKKVVSARGAKYESYKFKSGIGNWVFWSFSSSVSWESVGGIGVLSSGLDGASRVLRGFMLLWWSRLFRGARSGVKKSIIIQEMERPPPSGCCRLAVMAFTLKVVF